MATARATTSSPLPGCAPLFAAAAMREADRAARERYGVPSVVLMEGAGIASAQAILAAFPGAGAAQVIVGPGNNGGDGMVVARHLAEAGWAVEVAAPGGRGPETPDGVTMAGIAAALGIAVVALAELERRPDAVVVDALLGTGARGAPSGPIGEAVDWIAAHPGPVAALDLPSGVDADSGRVPGAAVRADLTITFHGDLIGLRVMPGAARAGSVLVADIGIPSAVGSAPGAWLAGDAVLAGVAPRPAEADKYAAGAVLVVAGAPGLTGAAVLAARSTLRAGAGLTVLATPAAAHAAAAAHLLEVMAVALPDHDGYLGPESVPRIVAEAGRVGVIAIGPGLGRADATTEAVWEVLEAIALPAIVDADGLWHLSGSVERLSARAAPTVLTPHAGEAARLLGRRRREVEEDRLASARELAARSGAVTVLKGPGTICAAPAGETIVNATGSAALATAGSGDVLTGVVAAMLARGHEPLAAAALAVAAHGRAGEIADRGGGTIASDVLEALPEALRPAAG